MVLTQTYVCVFGLRSNSKENFLPICRFNYHCCTVSPMGTRRATEDDMRKKQVYTSTYATKLCNPASKKKLHAPILILDETNPNSPVENWGEILSTYDRRNCSKESKPAWMGDCPFLISFDVFVTKDPQCQVIRMLQ